MCGIAGMFELHHRKPVSEQDIRQMLAMIRHRGPDEFGIYLDKEVGIGNARLSIIDLSTGQQPICNEDGTLWIVFNGEIFNYLELRPELERQGHRFTTNSDTEVLLHLYEQYGPGCLERLNGQFAFAIWNSKNRMLFLARDRLGVRPLFYTLAAKGTLVFGSEIKALLASGRANAELDPIALGQVFTYWCPLSPRTAFRNVFEVPPGHYLVAGDGKVDLRRYWQLTFPQDWHQASKQSAENYAEELRQVLIDAATIRLRADVPVGAYLSGGLDSSVIAFIVRHFTTNRLDTFSIAFDDTQFDESTWQCRMAASLGTNHQIVRAKHTDIAEVFPEVVWHAEVPLVRTAPAPMFLLSKLVRDCGYKVVLTGEGADEFLGGYDIFKEAKIRRFWAAQADSRCRPLLLKRLYPDIAAISRNSSELLSAFFRHRLKEVESPDYSHAVRWHNCRRNLRFLNEDVRQQATQGNDSGLEAQIPPDFQNWSPLARAQYLEVKIFLSQYLLSSQGDRMGMAHSIEGRFPFLDYRLVDFCNRLPSNLKLRGLTEKYLLKQVGKKWLPREIWGRPKRPYRAPIHRSFFAHGGPDYVRTCLSTENLKATGLFRAEAVSGLVKKIEQKQPIGETDDMALAGILSAQLLHGRFISHFERTPPLSGNDKVKVQR